MPFSKNKRSFSLSVIPLLLTKPMRTENLQSRIRNETVNLTKPPDDKGYDVSPTVCTAVCLPCRVRPTVVEPRPQKEGGHRTGIWV
ncbi:hypothetical protein F5Y06DRAFT_53295 [Hypoxylon sp. FL0890]|nr:hypothetical protein F5Y06DRAFT_53295 [Hypoxylon sp. FL0890]